MKRLLKGGIGLLYKIEKNLSCIKCGSNNVGNLFNDTEDPVIKLNKATNERESIDSENYRIHFDCYCCYDCLKWDFPGDTWYSYKIIGYECNCGNNVLDIDFFDRFSGDMEFTCNCGDKYNLNIKIIN